MSIDRTIKIFCGTEVLIDGELMDEDWWWELDETPDFLDCCTTGNFVCGRGIEFNVILKDSSVDVYYNNPYSVKLNLNIDEKLKKEAIEFLEKLGVQKIDFQWKLTMNIG